MKFVVTGISANASNNEEIHIEFETNNEIDQVFLNDLGRNNTPLNSPLKLAELDCVEVSSSKKLSNDSNSKMNCYLYDGDYDSFLPAIVKIPVS